MLEIFQIQIPNIVPVWREVEPFIDRAIDHTLGEEDRYDNLSQLLSGRRQLWVVRDTELKAVCTTEIIDFPKCRKLLIVHLGGKEMEAWLDPLVEKLEEFARYNHCAHLEARGRKGWIKVSEHLGFKPTYQIITKELNYE